MYRILLLISFLTISNSLECLHHVCSAAFKACDLNHNSHECWNWADDTFHCCKECESCDTPTSKVAVEEKPHNLNWERECHSQLCDAILDVCTSTHSNSSDCIARADKASHCCYLCMDCPHKREPHHNKCDEDFCNTVYEHCEHTHNHSSTYCTHIADAASGCSGKCQDNTKKKTCDEDFCNAVYEHCTESNHHNHSSTYCQHVADVASDCSGKCQDTSMLIAKENECHPHFCTAVYDICTHHSNSTDCQYKADEASNCCYNCMDCPSGVEKPVRPRYDHCLSDLCDKVFHVCITDKQDPDACRIAADQASDCCNMCDDCH